MSKSTIKVSHYQEMASGTGGRKGRDYKGLPILANRGIHEFVAAHLSKCLKPGSHLLELGSGSGALSLRLAELGFRVTAVDYVAENFRASHDNIDFKQADLNADLPESEREAYDAVVAVEIIEHLENTRHFTRLLKSALKPGGFLMITTPNINSPKSAMTFLLTGRFDLFLPRHYVKDGHINPVPWFVMRDALEEAGFEEISVGSHKSAAFSLKGIFGAAFQLLGLFNGSPKGKKLVATAIKPGGKKAGCGTGCGCAHTSP
ncbi:methyltransferase domain-containing protein [Akkermansiaceae bacterium]|nr:methyltransferase domain-containing protein [Akkermansiaceae bacterium]